MRQFRYRTPALVGPWRDSPGDAARDAAEAGQLVIEPASTLRWMVRGEIEEKVRRQPADARSP